MAYATSADLQTYMQQTVDATMGDLVLQLVSDEIDARIGRTLSAQTYTDLLLDGPVPGSSTLILPAYPVSSITALSVLPQLDEGWIDLVAQQDYVWSTNGIVTRIDSAYTPDSPVAPFWPRYPQSIKVSFTGGYDTAPAAARAVCLSAAARIVANPSGLVSERIGSYEVRFGVNNQDAVGGVKFNSVEELALGRLREVVTA